MQIIDRTHQALGGQAITGSVGRYANGRAYSAIKDIVIHYSGVACRQNRHISGHEAWWRTLKWSRGGYHYWIDAQGRIHQNYVDRRITFGAGNINATAINICVEANSGTDYSDAQLKSRDWLVREIMKRYNIPASRVIGHFEAPGQSTKCPGYNKAQMNAIRRDLQGANTVSNEAEVVDVDRKIPLSVAIHQLNFETSQWGTKLIDVDGEFKVGGTRIMTRFGTPNVKSAQGGWAEPGYVVKFNQIALVGGFAWLRYTFDGKVKYIPFAFYQNGRVSEEWGTFL